MENKTAHESNSEHCISVVTGMAKAYINHALETKVRLEDLKITCVIKDHDSPVLVPGGNGAVFLDMPKDPRLPDGSFMWHMHSQYIRAGSRRIWMDYILNPDDCDHISSVTVISFYADVYMPFCKPYEEALKECLIQVDDVEFINKRADMISAINNPEKYPRRWYVRNQVIPEYILLDTTITPLMESLWLLGIFTDFSCAGHPHGTYIGGRSPSIWLSGIGRKLADVFRECGWGVEIDDMSFRLGLHEPFSTHEDLNDRDAFLSKTTEAVRKAFSLGEDDIPMNVVGHRQCACQGDMEVGIVVTDFRASAPKRVRMFPEAHSGAPISQIVITDEAAIATMVTTGDIKWVSCRIGAMNQGLPVVAIITILSEKYFS